MTSFLTEEQKDFVRKEAFMMERSREDTIDEAAWQLGEHPLVIGGGSITLSAGGETFIKGDVRKIYAEHGIAFDGTPRFGIPPYKQRYSPPIDWIARGRTPSGTKQRQSLQNSWGYQLRHWEQLPLLEPRWLVLLQKRQRQHLPQQR